MAQPIPEGTHTVTPYLCVRGAAQAMEFYQRALGAQEIMRMPGPGGKLMHCEFQIGDSRVYMSDEVGGRVRSPRALKGSTVGLHVYVPDCDALFNRAVGAGCKVVMPLMDMFWGDRFGQIADPYGHVWTISTHVEDVPFEEMGQRAAAAMAQMPPPKPKAKPRKAKARRPARKTAAKKPGAKKAAKHK
jgi:PhnB protein